MKLPELKLFRRSFISIVISATQIKAIRINTKNNSLVKLAQADIPPGVIINFRVRDEEALVNIIKNMWAKNGFRDKYVGVIVPEFSTYTKTIELPSLTDLEINEALTWKLQEYLPVALDEVVFDWKIIKRENNKALVLVVAILKDVLLGYVDAVGSAGLSPLVVETPSLSIQRIVDKDVSGKLLIYVSAHETILVITSENELVASSVVNSNDFNIAVNTARQMLNHYSNYEVEKIILCGVGLTQDLIQFLNYNLGLPVQFSDIKVKGLMPGQVQDFLVGISLQYQEPLAPASELTVNLLPLSWAEQYKQQASGAQLWSLTLIAAFGLWAVFLPLLIAYMLLGLQAERLQGGDAEARTQELNEVVAQVREINTLVDTVGETVNKIVYPQLVFNSLASSQVSGVDINTYRVNYATGEVVVSGLAAQRADLLAYKNSLEENEDFSSVNLPIASLIQASNINFEIRMLYTTLVPRRNIAPTRRINI